MTNIKIDGPVLIIKGEENIDKATRANQLIDWLSLGCPGKDFSTMTGDEVIRYISLHVGVSSSEGDGLIPEGSKSLDPLGK